MQNKNISYIKSTLVCYFFLFVPLISLAKEFHVSVNGSDGNIGSLSHPFRTILFSIQKLSKNDTLSIHEGEYFIDSTIVIKSNCIIRNFQNEKVTIKLLRPIFNWVKVQDNIWKISGIDSVYQLYINNRPFFQASFPTISESMNAFDQGNLAIAYSNKEIEINGVEKYGDIIGARYLGLHGNRIVSLNGNIEGISNNRIKIYNNSFVWNEAYKLDYLGEGKAILFGSKKFLDTHGEWFWEKGELFFYSDVNPNELIISARTSLNAFDLANCSEVKIEGLTFFSGSLNLSKASYCKVTNCSILYPTPFFTFPEGFEKFNFLWDENNNSYVLEPDSWNGKGLTVSGSNNIIENCYVAHSWGDGITVWGENNIIRNNEIFDCDWIANDCANLTVTGKNQLVSNNTIHQSGRSLIVHRDIESSSLVYNNLYHNGIHCEDLGMTATFLTDGKNTELAYNYLHDTKARVKNHGIYLDNGNKNFHVHHNIVNNCIVGIQLNKPAENIRLHNNTLYNNQYSMGSWGWDELVNIHTFNNLSNTNKKNNLYDAFYGTELDSNYVYFNNNIFEDPKNHNFQLRKNSYPIDKGLITDQTIDFTGTLPDMGAIEFGTNQPLYGSDIIYPNEDYYTPKPPIKLKISATKYDSLLLNWEYPFQKIDSFYIERKMSTENTYSLFATVSASILKFNDVNRPIGEYRYQVRAKNQFGISDPSNTVQDYKSSEANSIYLDSEESDLQDGISSINEIITNLDNKDWVAFKQIDFGDTLLDACKLRIAVPCSESWQNIQVRKDGIMGKIIGEYITENTGGLDLYEIKEFPIEPINRVHDIYIKFRGKKNIGKIDWFEFYNSEGKVIHSVQKDSKCPKPYVSNNEIFVKLFPNPGVGVFRVNYDCKELSVANVQVFNTIGNKLFDHTYSDLHPGEIELYVDSDLNSPNFTCSFYIVKVTITSENNHQETILKYIRL
jgi:hypothetical protein